MGGVFMKKLAKSALLLLTAVLCLGLFTMTADAATTSKTTTKTTTKKVTMASKAKKSKKVKTTKTKKTTKKTKKKNQQTTKVTTVKTTVQTTYRKNSRIKTVQTTVKTNVKTTTKKVAAASASKKTAKTAVAGASSTDIYDLAPKAGSNIKSAFTKLGFTVKVNSSASYSGYFNAKDQSITLKKLNDDCIYHELGHFVAFVAGNVDKKAEFQAIYKAEKSKYTAWDKSYVTSSASEYFAESYKNFVEDPGELQASRPQTYAYVAKAAAAITDSQVAKVSSVYSPFWK